MKRRVVIGLSFLMMVILSAGCSKEKEITVSETTQVTTDDKTKETSEAEQEEEVVEEVALPSLTYISHASIKIKTLDGIVIYIDPSYGSSDFYSEPADLVLITHFHGDHYNLNKISDEKAYELITPTEAILEDGTYQSFEKFDVKIEAVAAYNGNHSKSNCVGYILEFDGIKLYHAGDTSKTSEMDALADKEITYALLPMDNVYNMGPEEAMEVADIIQAQYYIPIHTGPDGVYSDKNVEKFQVDNKIVLKPKEQLTLVP